MFAHWQLAGREFYDGITIGVLAGFVYDDFIRCNKFCKEIISVRRTG